MTNDLEKKIEKIVEATYGYVYEDEEKLIKALLYLFKERERELMEEMAKGIEMKALRISLNKAEREAHAYNKGLDDAARFVRSTKDV